ncbi:L,D-transpeptidase [Amycolatopsis roodepoortensis]|uniref:L,D-transpeptidase n=1 Tax=Amycolatopsis roodepoortensis TaxID=700274 RepID=UPI00214C520B|nr:L,D-transpeptidase [Amycolatopsis roodepoortensis]UUV32051.1 L,D-transpeptidase [Amycolatopsis roodepoortensis]
MDKDGDQTPRPSQAGHEQDASLGPNTPPGRRGSTEPPSSARNRRAGLAAIAGLAAVAIALAAAITFTSGESTAKVATLPAGSEAQPAPEVEQIVAPQEVSAQSLAGLPQATTFTTISGAPHDPAPSARTSGRIIHPIATIAVYAQPGGPPIAALPAQQTFGELRTETKVPVITEEPGWAQVLLPSRPNGSTGWVSLDDPAVTIERSKHRLVVDRAHFTLTLFEQDRHIGVWTVGIGRPGAITPAGRTFILSSILDTSPKAFSPVVLPLGSHSDTYSSYGGGPGTVGLHSWPTPAVFGRASSDGCVRVPADALDVISRTVPLGSLVEIT